MSKDTEVERAGAEVPDATVGPIFLKRCRRLQGLQWYLFVGMIALLLLIPLIPIRALWEPEELRYAEIVREMLSRGEWILLHINGVAYPDKPPLFYWFIGLLAQIAGQLNIWTMRLPCVLGGVGCVLLTYEAGRRLLGRRTGVLAALILAATPFFMWSTSEARMDSVFTFWILAGNVAAISFMNTECLSRRRSLLIFLFGALALMTKGPAGLIITLAGPVAYLIVIKRWRWILKIRWGQGILVAAVVILPWLIAACVKGGGDFARDLTIRQSAGRFVDPWIHSKPLLTYFWQFPAEFAPWTIFIPFMFYNIFSAQEQHRRKGFLYALCAFLSVFLLFTLSQSKRSIYLLPCFPWAAILLAGLLDLLIAETSQDVRTLRVRIPLCITFVLAILGGIIFLAVYPWLSPILGDRLAPLALTMIVTGAVTLILMVRGHRKLTLSVFLAGIYVSWLTGTLVTLPVIDRFKSAQPFCDRLAGFAAPGVPVAIRRSDRTGYGYYLNRILPTLRTDADITEFFERNPVAFCIVKESDMDSLRCAPAYKSWPVFRGQVGGRSHVVIANIPVVDDYVKMPAERARDVQAGLFRLKHLDGAVLRHYTATEVTLWAHQPDVQFELDIEPGVTDAERLKEQPITVTLLNFPGEAVMLRGPMERSNVEDGNRLDRVRLKVTPNGTPCRMWIDEDRKDYSIAVFGAARVNSVLSVFARARLLAQIKRLKPTFAVSLGDMVNLGVRGEYEEFAQWVRALGVPCYGLAGPEDLGAHDSGSLLFDRLFGMAPRQFTCGRWQIVFLNSRIGLYGRGQLDWLQSALTPATRGRGLVFMHHPPFIPKTPDEKLPADGEAAQLMGLLKQARPRLAVAAHGAFFFEQKIDGLDWIITRGGAEKIRTYGVKTPFRRHHLILLKLGEDRVATEVVKF